MVERELKIRYKNSIGGFMWSLVNPLITVLVMTVVFKYLVGNQTPNFSAYILAAYLPFMFFQFSILDSAQSVLAQLPLVKKIYFPREILPLASIISNFIHLLLALLVFFVFLLWVYVRNPGIVPFKVTALMLPVLLIINFMLSCGLGLIVSALNTFYEDVKYVVSVLLYLMFFLCPIMYFSENVAYSKAIDESHRVLVFNLYHLNPMATLATAYRKCLLAPQKVYVDGKLVDSLDIPWMLLGITALMSFGLLVVGYWTFNRLKWRFVERP